ncbi:MAG: porin family protein [Bacteroidota bacterium]
MKNYAIFILLLGLTTNAIGQENKVEIGIEGGPSFSYMRIYPIISGYSTSGISAYSSGVFFQYNLKKWLSIRTNLSYERKGDNYRYYYNDAHTSGICGIKVLRHFDYFTLPILAKASIGGKIKCFYNMGPFISYLKSASYLNDYDQINTFEDGTDTYETIDAGITTGVGIDFQYFKNFSFSCEVRRNTGMTGIIKEFDWKYPSSLKTNSINLLIGLTYKIKKTIEKN